jgi:zinc transporter ZupT
MDSVAAPKTKSTRENVNKKIRKQTSNIAKPACCSGNPVERLETFRQMASVLEHETEMENQSVVSGDDDFIDNLPLPSASSNEIKVSTASLTKAESSNKNANVEDEMDKDIERADSDTVVMESDDSLNSGTQGQEQVEEKKLAVLGYNTAIAIGIHNFPEGLATFVAALEDPRVGAVLAVAIAVHNIPEGLCVSLPIYYATGSRIKGFMWGLLSGASEILAALLGWIILASVLSPITYAVLYSLVAGMMVIISIHQLLPTAHVYDPEDKYVTYSFIGGMGILALSLVLFKI